MAHSSDSIPDILTLDEAYRAAFYLVLKYIALQGDPDDGLILLRQYMWTDPARWSDWKSAVAMAISDDGRSNPDHEGQWQDRPEMPSIES